MGALIRALVHDIKLLGGSALLSGGPESWTTSTNHSHDALVALGALSGHFCDATTEIPYLLDMSSRRKLTVRQVAGDTSS